jgi:ankyrin repeat protein
MEADVANEFEPDRPSRDQAFRGRVARLLAASFEGNADAVRTLLDEDALAARARGPHPVWDGEPLPLHVAAEWGRTDVVRLLLAARRDPP